MFFSAGSIPRDYWRGANTGCVGTEWKRPGGGTSGGGLAIGAMQKLAAAASFSRGIAVKPRACKQRVCMQAELPQVDLPLDVGAMLSTHSAQTQ